MFIAHPIIRGNVPCSSMEFLILLLKLQTKLLNISRKGNISTTVDLSYFHTKYSDQLLLGPSARHSLLRFRDGAVRCLSSPSEGTALRALLVFCYLWVRGSPEGITPCGKLRPHQCLHASILLSRNNKLRKVSAYTQGKALSCHRAAL